MIKVKICGIIREEDLRAAIEAGTGSIGFISLARAKPHGIDVSSGVEVRPNLKDRKKIFEFVTEEEGGSCIG